MKIGWIGTGVMGNAMCSHLMKKFKEVFVYNRTQSKADNLVELGAKYSTVLEISQQCDVIITMLGFPKDVEDVFFNESYGIIKHAKKSTLVIDHTTSSPSLAKRIYDESILKGIGVIDAPVSGGDVGAKNGALVVMCGGSKEDYIRSQEYLNCYSKAIEHFGNAGYGQHAKMCNQISVASSISAVCETLLYAQKVGIDAQKLIDLIKNGAAQSFSLERYGPRILNGDLKPGFYVEHFVKDMEICLDECRRMNISLPSLTTVHQLYKLYIAQGGAKQGAHGLIECLRYINNIK